MIRRFSPFLILILTLLNPTVCPGQSAHTASGLVFGDGFSYGLDYNAFEFSYYDAMTVEPSGGYKDSPTIMVTIPMGTYAGGAFFHHTPQDLSCFNALTFYAKASTALNLDAVGFGISIVAPSDYQVTFSNFPLTETWTQITIPVPDPARLTHERGMFWYSHSPGGVTIWFDEVEFQSVSNISNPRPVMDSADIDVLLGLSVPVTGTMTTYEIDGVDHELVHSPRYFTYISSDESVVLPDNGMVTAVGGGTATITAALFNGEISTPVDGGINVTVITPPETAAPVPTRPQDDVISLFSDSYNSIDVNSWCTVWSSASIEVFDQTIEGDHVKVYTGFTSEYFWAGIDFQDDQIDVETSGMTHFHMDVYALGGATFGIKLIDFGFDGSFGGGDDSEGSVIFNQASNPAFVSGEWISLDIALEQFGGMNFGNIAQMLLFSFNGGAVWIDNVYFSRPSTVGADEGVPPRWTGIISANPNPFNPKTEIRFDVSQPGPIELRIADLAGRTLRTIRHTVLTAGRQRLTWDGRSEEGLRVASGIYLVQLKTRDGSDTKRITLLK